MLPLSLFREMMTLNVTALALFQKFCESYALDVNDELHVTTASDITKVLDDTSSLAAKVAKVRRNKASNLRKKKRRQEAAMKKAQSQPAENVHMSGASQSASSNASQVNTASSNEKMASGSSGSQNPKSQDEEMK